MTRHLHYERDKIVAALAKGRIPETEFAIALLDAQVEVLWDQCQRLAAGRYRKYRPPGPRGPEPATDFWLGLWDFYTKRVENPQLGEGGPFYDFVEACTALVGAEMPDPKSFRKRMEYAIDRTGRHR